MSLAELLIVNGSPGWLALVAHDTHSELENYEVLYYATNCQRRVPAASFLLQILIRLIIKSSQSLGSQRLECSMATFSEAGGRGGCLLPWKVRP